MQLIEVTLDYIIALDYDGVVYFLLDDLAMEVARKEGTSIVYYDTSTEKWMRWDSTWDKVVDHSTVQKCKGVFILQEEGDINDPRN